MKIRAIQLDLARQPETLDSIRDFIDLAVKYGYNYLGLYLEGMVKTKSFSYTNEALSYTSDDMREIVNYAAKRKMEVMPLMQTLGHVHQFLQFPELEHLAELRDGREGRFSNFKQVFCPSLKETYAFLENYLSEIAEIFPSEYFHAGCDEAWDIGYCDLCMKRLEKEAQADIFTKHLVDVHNIVVGKLKKKMIIWDDLFDMYPQTLVKIPKDIIMCSWHYDKLVERPSGHCGGPQTDKFALYDKLGFSYIFAPASYTMRNVESFSEYGMSKASLGGLLTIWDDLRRHEFPVMAYAGMTWSRKKSSVPIAEFQDKAILDMTGCMDEELVSIVKIILSLGQNAFSLPDKSQAYLRGPLNNAEYDRKLFIDTAQSALVKWSSATCSELQRDVMEDLKLRVAEESIYFELRDLMTAMYALENTPRQWTELGKRAKRCAVKVKDIKTRRHQQWNHQRKGITPCRSDACFDTLIKMLTRAPAEAKKIKALLKVTFPFDAPNAEYLIKYQNEKEWRKAMVGSFVNTPFSGVFHYYFPLDSDKIPEAVRIEQWGYVGLRISFLEVENRHGRFVPASIGAIEGLVSHPELLLEEGTEYTREWCFLGDNMLTARRKFLNPSLAKVRNSLEINLCSCPCN